MKKILLVLSVSIALFSCNDSHHGNVSVNEPNVVVNPTTSAIGDNLDLQALGELVQTSSSAEEIESKLNSSGSINNLDLNGDGSVDYIRVSEIGDGANRGFSFTVDMPDGTTSEVATIDIDQSNGVANMNIHGNQEYYGNNGYYHSSHELRDLMIMSYLLSNHRPYYSPYHYGHYPSSYRSYRSVPTTTYRTKTVTRTTRTSPSRSTATRSTTKATTPATARTKSLAAPTRSQKSFTRTIPAKARPVTTGFGKSRSTTTRPTRSRSSWGSSSSSRRSSGSSWGSSSRRSSGSSWGSSSRRSSGFGSSSRSSRRR